MNKPSNQDIEKYYFEMFRKDYSLPPGTITYTDAPDVILDGARQIGIEITNFFLEKGSLPESEQSQRRLQEKIVSYAQQSYQANNRKKFEISFGFNKANPIRDQKILITKIIQLAINLEKSETGQIPINVFKSIPELSFVYLNASEYPDAKWRIVQVYNVPIMSRVRLLDIVRDKEERAKKYKRCDSYWLVVVVDSVNSAQDQEIRLDFFNKIHTEIFEKVIVYKPYFSHILEVT
jgi:hypothetical protein